LLAGVGVTFRDGSTSSELGQPRRRLPETLKGRDKRPRSCVHKPVPEPAYRQDLCDAGLNALQAARRPRLTWGYGDPFRIRATASARPPEPIEHSDVPVHGSLTQLRVLVGRTSPRNWNKTRDGAGD